MALSCGHRVRQRGTYPHRSAGALRALVGAPEAGDRCYGLPSAAAMLQLGLKQALLAEVARVSWRPGFLRTSRGGRRPLYWASIVMVPAQSLGSELVPQVESLIWPRAHPLP